MKPRWYIKLKAIQRIITARSLIVFTERFDGAHIDPVDTETMHKHIIPAAQYVDQQLYLQRHQEQNVNTETNFKYNPGGDKDE